MTVVFKNKNLIVVYKPAKIPSQPDKSGDKDIMTETSEYLLSAGERADLWLINRLDRVVGGLMLFARNKKSAAELSEMLGAGIVKEYLAVTDGRTDGEGTMKDLIFKDAAKSKAFIVDRVRMGVKEAELEYKSLEFAEGEKDVKTLVKVRLKTGRFHQIRAQFSKRGLPLTGDKKYGSRDVIRNTPALFAYRLAFNHRGENIDVKILPNREEYPWSLFSEYEND